MADRHDLPAREMSRRDYAHRSPLPDCAAALGGYPAAVREGGVDRGASARELAVRCPDCAGHMAGEEPAAAADCPA